MKPQDDMLARIDERTLKLVEELRDIRDELRHRYVSKEEFEPIKLSVFGLIGAVFVSLVAVSITMLTKA